MPGRGPHRQYLNHHRHHHDRPGAGGAVRSLLVCDCSTCQQVQVNTANACRYQVGDRLCIHYNGAMTNSIPPQISATCIHRR